MRFAIALMLCAATGLGQTEFSVASVKSSAGLAGRDFGDRITYHPNGFSGQNITLKRLIIEAYQIRAFQVAGGPKWLDRNEYEVEARADGPIDRGRIATMLRKLLVDRFGLSVRRERRPLRVYELVVDNNGPRKSESGLTMEQFCNLLSVKLTIPVMDDPGKPGLAAEQPVPVVDRTGLAGTYEMPSELRPEPGADMFTLWQRALKDLGLRLVDRKSETEIIVVDAVRAIPSAN
jgi:hypothetical protein